MLVKCGKKRKSALRMPHDFISTAVPILPEFLFECSSNAEDINFECSSNASRIDTEYVSNISESA